MMDRNYLTELIYSFIEKYPFRRSEDIANSLNLDESIVNSILYSELKHKAVHDSCSLWFPLTEKQLNTFSQIEAPKIFSGIIPKEIGADIANVAVGVKTENTHNNTLQYEYQEPQPDKIESLSYARGEQNDLVNLVKENLLEKQVVYSENIRKYKTWEVAAAFLCLNNKEAFHYNKLTEKVITSKLSTLGEKGKTPAQSLNAITRNMEDVFFKKERGYVELSKKFNINNYPRVTEILKLIQAEKESFHLSKNTKCFENTDLSNPQSHQENESKIENHSSITVSQNVYGTTTEKNPLKEHVVHSGNIRKYKAWEVAVAFLYLDNRQRVHYTNLTEKVITSKLSTLGEKGTTPAQTLNAEIRKMTKIFWKEEKGYVKLSKEFNICNYPRVAEIINLIQKSRNNPNHAENIKGFRDFNLSIPLLKEPQEKTIEIKILNHPAGIDGQNAALSSTEDDIQEKIMVYNGIQKYKAWEVAAAVLCLNKNQCFHYGKLTEKVIFSKLSTLGERGKTPAQSLNAIIRSMPEIFSKKERGDVELSKNFDINNYPRVAEIILWLAQATNCTAVPEKITHFESLSIPRQPEERLQIPAGREDDYSCHVTQHNGAVIDAVAEYKLLNSSYQESIIADTTPLRGRKLKNLKSLLYYSTSAIPVSNMDFKVLNSYGINTLAQLLAVKIDKVFNPTLCGIAFNNRILNCQMLLVHISEISNNLPVSYLPLPTKAQKFLNILKIKTVEDFLRLNFSKNLFPKKYGKGTIFILERMSILLQKTRAKVAQEKDLQCHGQTGAFPICGSHGSRVIGQDTIVAKPIGQTGTIANILIDDIPLGGRELKILKSHGIATLEQFLAIEIGKAFSPSYCGAGTFNNLLASQASIANIPTLSSESPISYLSLPLRAGKILNMLKIETIDDFLKLDFNKVQQFSRYGHGTISILEKMIFLLQTIHFQVDQEQRPNFYDKVDINANVNYLNLGTKIKKAFAFLGINTIQEYLNFDTAHIKLPAGYGTSTVVHIKELSLKLNEYNKVVSSYNFTSNITEKPLKLLPLFTSIPLTLTQDKLHISYYAYMSLKGLNLTTKLRIDLEYLKITDLGKLLLTPYMKLKEKLTDTSITNLQNHIINFLTKPRGISINWISCDALVKTFIEQTLNDSRSRNIYCEKLGIYSDNVKTLEEIATDYNITRERVRQIYIKTQEKIAFAIEPLKRFWDYSTYILKYNAGIILITDFIIEIASEFKWKSLPDENQIRWLLSLNESLVFVNKDWLVLKDNPCLNCNNVKEYLVDSLDCERFIEIKDVTEYIFIEYCHKCKEATCSFPISLLKSIISANSELQKLYAIENNLIYAMDFWILSKGLITSAINLLLNKNLTMTVEDIYVELCRYRSDISLRYIQNTINRCDFALVERGTYTLRKNIKNIPDYILSHVNSYITQQFNNSAQILNVSIIFDKYIEELKKIGIISEYSFYEALKASKKIEARFIKCPYLVSMNSSEKFSIANTILDYIRANGDTTVKDIFEFFNHQLGIKKHVLLSALKNNPDLLIDGKSNIILFDNLNLPEEEISRIINYVKDKTSNGAITSKQVFTENHVACRAAGIKDAKFLFYILKRLLSDKYQFKNPQISRLNTDIKSMLDQINEFLINKQTFCTMDEIEDEFVKKRKFSSGSVSGIVYNDRIQLFRYLDGCVVHKSIIGWNQQKQDNVLSIARQNLNRNIHKFYAYIEDILNLYSAELPPLGNGIDWTSLLISDILMKSGSFILLGNYKNIYTSVDNPHGICNLGDLCGQILWDQYNGATGLEELSKDLRNRRLIAYELKESMLGNSHKVKITGKEIIAKRGI